MEAAAPPAPPRRRAAFWEAAGRVKAVPSATAGGDNGSASAKPQLQRLGDGEAADGGAASPHKELSRSLGPVDLVLLGIGASIGAGIFVVTGVAARQAGPAVALSFALAGLACVIDALCYAELASRFPAVVGGAYLYTYATFGELAAFLVFCNLMFDYHIGAASIARSLASYLASLLLEVLPGAIAWLPAWLSPSGMPLLSGLLSINALAPLILAGLTVILCHGVRKSATLNTYMTTLKVVIVLLVIAIGSTRVNPANWHPFAPHGAGLVVSAASTVYFAYVGFDARDLPIGIMVSLAVCTVLYVAVSLVITGMVPFDEIDPSSPLADAFARNKMPFVEGFINVGAVVGLTTTLLVGLFVQSRLYLGVGRDGLLPDCLSVVHSVLHTPVRAQVWVGAVAFILAALFDVARLSHILSVGVLVSYSVVCACVIVLRVDESYAVAQGAVWGGLARKQEAIACIGVSALLAFTAGLLIRWKLPAWLLAPIVLAGGLAVVSLLTRQAFPKAQNFACPFVPALPLVGIVFNVYLLAQMHYEAWIRLGAITLLAVVAYILYGRHHSRADYEQAPLTDLQ
eukprot:SM000258S09119  [mRNA]  locus=s258:92515:97200:- [translate_table: standard]